MSQSSKTILCYGDSNTWGFVPGSGDYATMYMERYSRFERWPGELQRLLGDQFYVIEEGLNGRTTNVDYQFPPDRNGKTYLPSCLYSHAPIDLAILSLGSNDLKAYFQRSREDICNGIQELIDTISSSKYGKKMLSAPEILLLSPIVPLKICEEFVDDEGIFVFKGAVEKSKGLASRYKAIAEKNNCYFLDFSKKIVPSIKDGIHMDEKGHHKLACMIGDKIKEIFSKL